MVNIIICEDDKFQRNKIENIIYNQIDKKNINMDIILSEENISKVITYSKNNKDNNNLYFLDVELKDGVNGIEEAGKIRNIDKNGIIVFVTSHSEMSLLTFEYKVQASDYIVKNTSNFENRIVECLENVDKRFNKVSSEDENFILVENSEKVVKENIDNILFIETSSNHKISIHAFDEIIEVYGTIREYQEKLPDYFIKTHRSYLVNSKNIKDVNKEKKIVIMKNGEECLVSRLSIKEVLKCVK